jgi:uncharacterized OB-fold protein
VSGRVLPRPDAGSEPFWAACADHVLKLPRCAQCGAFTLPPDLTCPHCHSLEPAFTYEPVAGDGTVRTWTVVRQSFLAGFDEPFVLVDVQLDAQPGVRMIGRLLDGPDAPLKAGDAVTLGFEDLAPGVSLPAFRLASRA